MKLVFAGTPAFAATALTALLDAGHDVVGVMTQPDRPAGRGLQVHPTPVKAIAVAHGIPVMQPKGLRIGGRHDADAREAHATLTAKTCDAMVVAAYGLILPPTVLEIPPHGCLNIHASLLPRWRGAAPIQRAIEAGDSETGITIMQMDEGLDTGPMLLVRSTPIGPSDTAATLTDRLAIIGGDAIVDALEELMAGRLAGRPQHAPGDDSGVTYAAKLSKAEARLDFAQPTRSVVDRIRAFDPWPGCSAALVRGDAGARIVLKVWHADAVPTPSRRGAAIGDPVPGQVLGWRDAPGVAAAVMVATGDGAVALTELQKPGGKRLPAAAFARDFASAADDTPRFVAAID